MMCFYALQEMYPRACDAAELSAAADEERL